MLPRQWKPPGVIWRGDSVIDGVPDTLDMLRAMGKKLVFVTNNSTKSRKGYLGKFTSLGLNINAVRCRGVGRSVVQGCEKGVGAGSGGDGGCCCGSRRGRCWRCVGRAAASCPPPGDPPLHAPPPPHPSPFPLPSTKQEEIYSSSYAAAAYLESINFDKGKKVYVIGETGILEELDLKGIPYLGGPADATKVVSLKPGEFMEHDHDVSQRGRGRGAWSGRGAAWAGLAAAAAGGARLYPWAAAAGLRMKTDT
jgi:hypothetical protein